MTVSIWDIKKGKNKYPYHKVHESVKIGIQKEKKGSKNKTVRVAIRTDGSVK